MDLTERGGGVLADMRQKPWRIGRLSCVLPGRGVRPGCVLCCAVTGCHVGPVPWALGLGQGRAGGLFSPAPLAPSGVPLAYTSSVLGVLFSPVLTACPPSEEWFWI